MQSENFFSLDDCINTNYKYESLLSCLVSQSNPSIIENTLNSNFSVQEESVHIIFGITIPKVIGSLDNKHKNMSITSNDILSTPR